MIVVVYLPLSIDLVGLLLLDANLLLLHDQLLLLLLVLQHLLMLHHLVSLLLDGLHLGASLLGLHGLLLLRHSNIDLLELHLLKLLHLLLLGKLVLEHDGHLLWLLLDIGSLLLDLVRLHILLCLLLLSELRLLELVVLKIILSLLGDGGTD